MMDVRLKLYDRQDGKIKEIKKIITEGNREFDFDKTRVDIVIQQSRIDITIIDLTPRKIEHKDGSDKTS